MRAISSSLASLLSMVFFFLFPVGLLLLTVQTTLLDPSFYKRQFVQNDVYGKSFSLIGEVVGDSKELSRELPLPNSEIELVVKDLIPRDYIQRQTENTIDQLFVWLWSADSVPRITFQLAEVKARVPAAMSAAAERQVAKLRPCPAGYQPKMNPLPDCILPGIDPEALKLLVRQDSSRVGQELAKKLTDSFTLAEALDSMGRDGREVRSALDSVKQNFGKFKSAAAIVYAALVGLIVMIVVLTYGPFGQALKWVGGIVFLSGLVLVAIFLLGHTIAPPLFEQFAQAELHGPARVGPTLAVDLVRSIVLDITMRLYVEAGVAAGVGFVMLLVGRLSIR